MAKKSRKQVSFIANTRLKDIVGRELINDDNVAIIELIKNAKDADSKSVNVRFGKIPAGSESESLLIQDSGHGMNAEDLELKWLNIAYSEKKDANTRKKKTYAGNKGIGRFSCDRLGEKLVLYSKRKRDQLYKLEIDWTEFEVDNQKKQIGSVKTYIEPISFEQLHSETGIKKFTNGTILHIQQLRSNWQKGKLLRLRRQLEKFVVDPTKTFKINLESERYFDDQEVAGEIENKIFDTLDFRTTSIHASIDPSGDEIETVLKHDGEELFILKERNPYQDLSDVHISVFFLNQPAKAFFNRRSGYRSVEFGSILCFLNGFRVLPYGSESDDWLGLDQRRAQGQRRNLGTRELVGFIRIDNNSDEFKAVSSREGLVHNAAFAQLTSSKPTVESSLDGKQVYGLFHKVFRKLEVFVVKGLDWDRIKSESQVRMTDEQLLDPQNYEFDKSKQKIVETLDSIITLRSPKEHITDVEINFKYVFELAVDEAAADIEFVDKIQQQFEGTSVASLEPAEKRNLSKFIKRQTQKLKAKEAAARKLEKKLEVETKRRLFAEYESSADVEKLLGMQHEIGILASKVFKPFNRCVRKFRENPDAYSPEKLVALIEGAMFNLDKIRKLANFATKANFNLSSNKIQEDLVLFIEEYVEKIQQLSSVYGLRVSFDGGGQSLKTWFRPIEVMILVDNILDNAGKANAKRVAIEVRRNRGKLEISFIDNGNGLTNEVSRQELFERGVTTTSGSGIGLHHVKQIVTDMNGTVTILSNKTKGAKLVLRF